ncbi:MAG: TIM barrel protein, partial [Lachnospiraceae bacterium]|nr:TIM barrel protein [Lachnospiraceae bacterium]
MKLSFSIQNWNETGWSEFCDVAQNTHMSGIELYDIEGGNFSGKTSPTNPELSAFSRRDLTRRGLAIPCIDTVRDFTDIGFAREISESIRAAINLGAACIGIHTIEDDLDKCASSIEEILEIAGESPVTILVETTGAFASTLYLRDLLNRFSDDRLAALWDMYATTVEGGEDAETTITNLGAYVRHVHIHDYKGTREEAEPELFAEGKLPLEDLMNALRSVNYDGFISLFWDPDWAPEIADLEIILTHFATGMSRFENTRLHKKHLYWNNRHTGKYVWKKGVLIDKTFPQVLDTMVEEFPDQLAIKYTTLDYTRTYEEFRQDVDQFARALISLGVKPGSKVAIWATNVPAWFITFW